MKMMTIIGIILIAVGVIGLIYGGISYTSSRNAINMGDMHVRIDGTRQIPLSPIAAAGAVAIGVALILVGRRRSPSAAS